ncbi:MAG: PorT family protein, partial [Sphingobacteriaceae bacterium]
MKKIIVLAAGLFLTGAVSAQNNDDQISIGIKAGANFSNIIKSGESDFKTDYKTGFNAGVTLNIPIVER